MKTILTLLAVIVILFGLTSCGPEDSDSIARSEIRDILYDVSVDFNLNDIYAIMEHLSPEYLHKGMIAYHFNDLWLDRMAQFSLLEIEIGYIEISGDLAVVHSTNKFSSAYENVTLNEPDDSGDISYFRRENGVWRIYGNQQWMKGQPPFSRKGSLLVCR